MWAPATSSKEKGKGKSRYSGDDSNANKYKRCIECGDSDHFKCNVEKQSKLIKLTVKVKDNLNEFLFSEIEHNIKY